MHKVRFVIMLCTQLLLAGCVGIGIVATSDPLTKLNDAEYLFTHEDRPLPAEKLIFEAIEIYQKQNDSRGLGHAYREYGEFLLSYSVSKWAKVYRENGFQDKSVTFENRVTKSKEYFTKALEYYQVAEKQFLESERFDALTNIYFNMGWSYYRLDNGKKSCEFYDKTLAAYTENIRRNPTAKPQVSPSYGSIPDQIAFEKNRACGSQPQSENFLAPNAEALARAKGCMTCHSISEKVVGPPLLEIAKRYRNDPNAIAIMEQSILAGSKNTWGHLPMPGMEKTVSREDARMLATWVLSLEKTP